MPASPYTPGFGRRPPVVAGRDTLLDDVERVLEVGPEYHPLLPGDPRQPGYRQDGPLGRDRRGRIEGAGLGGAARASAAGRAWSASPTSAYPRPSGPGSCGPGFQGPPGAAKHRRGPRRGLGPPDRRARPERRHRERRRRLRGRTGTGRELRRRSRHRAAGHGGRGRDGTPGVPSALARALQTVAARRSNRWPSSSAGSRRSGAPGRRRGLRRQHPGRTARQPGAQRGAPGPSRARRPPPRGLGRRSRGPVSAPLGRPPLLRAAVRLARLGGGPGGGHDHPGPRQSRVDSARPSWPASTKPPGAACGPKSATTWPPWPAWPARTAPG